ncbi:MAG: thioredoxin [Acidibacillus sp.]|uniref:Thioredoxin n=1 Tax=Sulfoacidibacillus ferrooxidans TaxID=2005001 RepID=A0A9X1V5X7_9BACL|nr:thioredoxin [Sulfoacidibacillus ferrooxidans]MCI0181938.1 Thioredoxin [Sulfoacidibacillus ferrooxidans]MCY0893400.1 thioredoxin [Acidibacillus sp.]
MAVQDVTDQSFASFIKGDLPVMIDFWAAWCGPCKLLSPIVEELGKDLQGKLKVGKLNVDENPQIAGQFGIMSIPTLVVFKDGKAVRQVVGYMPKAQLQARIADLLG